MAATNTQPACLVRPVALLFGDRWGWTGSVCTKRGLSCQHADCTALPCFADASLTQHSFDPDGGWGAALAHHYQRKVSSRRQTPGSSPRRRCSTSRCCAHTHTHPSSHPRPTTQLDVVNRGWSGYNSRWGLPLFHETLDQLAGQHVALLVLWFGANDATILGRSA
jgi:hypothetical protein